MWFKNIQIFELIKPITFTANILARELEKMAFTPCLPNLPMSSGWVAPEDKDYTPLAYAANNCIMICLQVQEKILPSAIVNQELKEKIKQIEKEQQRKIVGEAKRSLKDSIYNSLLPQAFGKKTKIYAYFDTRNNLLIVDSVTEKKTELFLAIIKKSLPSITVISPELKKITPIMTHWLQNNSHPNSLEIGKKCIFQDPDQQSRIIRCQQQDLSARSIQSLLKDGFEVTQLEFNWQDQIKFDLDSNFMLRGLKFQDQVIESATEAVAENEDNRFSTDFIIMTDVLNGLLGKLIKIFVK